MNYDWKEEHCSQQPAETESIADGLLIQRRNIHEVHHNGEDGTYTDWQCESRYITVADYQLQHAAELASLNEAVDDLTVSILTGGAF